MRAGKELLQGLSSREASIFMQLTQLPAVVTSVLGLADKFPAFSTVISNVPGPREQLYWNGARLDGIYPASIVFDGFAMNITLVSYNNQLDFGIVACRRSLPQIQRSIDYLEDALQELEEVAGLRAVPARKPRAKRKAASKATAKNTSGKKSKVGAKSRAVAKPKAKAKAKPKAQPKAKAKAKAKAKTKPKTKAKAPVKTTSKSKPKARAKVRPKLR